MSYAEFKECSACTRPNDNKAFHCPERMSDGRLFTDHRTRSSTQYYNMITNNMPDAYSYRQYMTHNAEDLIKRNAAEAYVRAACGPCDEKGYDKGHMLPEIDRQECNSRSCTFRVTDPFGLGRGRAYDDEMENAAKKAFLEAKKKEQEWFKQTTECCGSKLEELQYYPIDGLVAQEYSRNAIPGGGAFMTGGSRLKTQGFD